MIEFVYLCAHCYLPMGRQDLTTCLAPSQHPCMKTHFAPTSSLPTPLHFVAYSILATNCLLARTPGLVPTVDKDSTTLHIPHTPWQSIQKSLGYTPLFSSPKSIRLWGVHRHRTGWCPFPLFNPLFKRSGLHCFNICLT